MQNYINQYENYLKIRGLAPRTIIIYTAIIKKYLKLHPNPKTVETSKIIAFMLQRGAARTIKQTHGALNHFYIGVLNSMGIKKIPQPKASEFVPNILSEAEVFEVVNSIKNLKHKAIILLIYSCALRVGETLNLKIKDISKTENKIKIINGKGNKTAYVPLPEYVKELLRNYYANCTRKPKLYLFEGLPEVKYSASSVRKILNQGLKSAGITKHIRVHDLRHSRATHLLENGMDIKMIKDVLRHKKIETTERYLHLTTVSLEKAMQVADIKMQSSFKFNAA